MDKLIEVIKLDPQAYLTTEEYINKIECFDSAL